MSAADSSTPSAPIWLVLLSLAAIGVRVRCR